MCAVLCDRWQMRIALARLLLSQPTLLLLDEVCICVYKHSFHGIPVFHFSYCYFDFLFDNAMSKKPTNHLDSSARNWLAQYLAEYDGTLVVVSHDTVLLENSISNICEVVPITKNIETYKIEVARRIQQLKEASPIKWTTADAQRK